MMRKRLPYESNANWDSFEKNHPELTVVRNGKRIVQIEFPLDANVEFCVIINNEVSALRYYLPDSDFPITYLSDSFKKNQLYEIVAQLSL